MSKSRAKYKIVLESNRIRKDWENLEQWEEISKKHRKLEGWKRKKRDKNYYREIQRRYR